MSSRPVIPEYNVKIEILLHFQFVSTDLVSLVFFPIVTWVFLLLSDPMIGLVD
jgi:hypothetical protein